MIPVPIMTFGIEGFGITFIEAASYGKASIGGIFGGEADAIIEGKTGYLCDGDDLNKLYETLLKTINNNHYEGKWSFVDDIERAIEDTDAVVVLTEWEQYGKINWRKVSKTMRRPAWVFDARSIINAEEVISSNLNMWRIGIGN